MDLSILSLLAQATLVAKAVLVVLLFMSVFSWALMFRKWMNIRAALKKAADGMDRFNHARDLREAVQSLGGDPDSPLYTVAHEGVTEFNRSKEAGNSEDVVVDNVRRALRQGVDMEMTRLTSSLSFLATSANTAPFIGLFGTVWGIMNTFHAIGAMKSASLATVAPGISEALIATAMGLLVAIPATIGYNTFHGSLNRVQRELNAHRAVSRSGQAEERCLMGSSVGGNKGFVSEINVTPFVDVMLVLLIIFMVTAPMMTEGLDVDLPQTRAVETLPTESDNMILTVRKDGAIFLDSYEVGLDELQDKINLLVKQQNKQLFLQADKDVAYGLVVDVMGRIREAGIDKLGVVALREDTPAVPEKKGKK